LGPLGGLKPLNHLLKLLADLVGTFLAGLRRFSRESRAFSTSCLFPLKDGGLFRQTSPSKCALLRACTMLLSTIGKGLFLVHSRPRSFRKCGSSPFFRRCLAPSSSQIGDSSGPSNFAFANLSFVLAKNSSPFHSTSFTFLVDGDYLWRFSLELLVSLASSKIFPSSDPVSSKKLSDADAGIAGLLAIWLERFWGLLSLGSAELLWTACDFSSLTLTFDLRCLNSIVPTSC